jgi:hypothetical protein
MSSLKRFSIRIRALRPANAAACLLEEAFTVAGKITSGVKMDV